MFRNYSLLTTVKRIYYSFGQYYFFFNICLLGIDFLKDYMQLASPNIIKL